MATDEVILLVEDNVFDEELTMRALERGGVTNRVVVAHNGVEALEIAARPEITIVLVLLDLNLPRLDGRAVLQRLRANERTQQLPVIFLLSSKYDEDALRVANHPATSCVRKPLDVSAFRAALEALGVALDGGILR